MRTNSKLIAALVSVVALGFPAAAMADGSSGQSAGSGQSAEQKQIGNNENSTTQSSGAQATTEQANIYAPVSVKSSGSNDGNVTQSNEAETTAVSGNKNTTEDATGQSQIGIASDPSSGGSGGHSHGKGGQSDHQVQVGNDENSTSQTSSSDATTNQVNIYAPVAVKSKGSNDGNVTQSNSAETTAVSGNENYTEEDIGQSQVGMATDPSSGGSGGHHHGKAGQSVNEVQVGENENSTTQSSSAQATTEQKNVDAPKAVKSKGSNDGNVTQENAAETTAKSGNKNGTEEFIGQSQTGTASDPSSGGSGGHSHGKGGQSVHEVQVGENENSTTQSSSANATTEQTNVYAPTAIKSKGSNDGSGSNDEGGGVKQANGAETTAVSGNKNYTEEVLEQTQKGTASDPSSGGSGGHSHGKGGQSVHEVQVGENENSTTQSSSANATTEQENIDKPKAVKSHGSNDGNVEQANGAETTAISGNQNATEEIIEEENQKGEASGS